ncbi:hypothetical protein R50073_02700 [Maricurvus nonylphenolicus]|uniref:sensor domain-containing diguanylate cyclase n=1 Tax=Maricurvus nonylphenolicus TaxID=1008307 RepID=UPI0036F1F18E
MDGDIHISLAQQQGLLNDSAHSAGLLNALAMSGDHFSIVDRNYTYQIVSDAYLRAHELEREQIIGRHVADMLGEDIFEQVVKPSLDNCFRGQKVQYRSDFTFKGYDGLRHMDVCYRPYRDVSGEVIGAIVSARDITDIRKEVEQLNALAHIDSLTQLPNRSYIIFLLYKSMARAHREGRSFSIAYCDLNDFKLVNDKLGHRQGDRVLKAVAERLRSALRSNEEIGRMGGDEFLLVLDEPLSKEEEVIVSERLKQALAEPFVLGEEELTLGISLGCARYPEDAESAETLIQVADDRMYRDKVQSRYR